MPLHSCLWRTKTADETHSPNTNALVPVEAVQENVNGSSVPSVPLPLLTNLARFLKPPLNREHSSTRIRTNTSNTAQLWFCQTPPPLPPQMLNLVQGASGTYPAGRGGSSDPAIPGSVTEMSLESKEGAPPLHLPPGQYNSRCKPCPSSTSPAFRPPPVGSPVSRHSPQGTRHSLTAQQPAQDNEVYTVP